MPSADETAETTEEAPVDEARQALLEVLTTEFGDTLVASHLKPGDDLWIRVANEAWTDTADYLRNRQRFRFFDWLSAIDWMPSPYGRSLDAAVDAETGMETVDEILEEALDTIEAEEVEASGAGTGAGGYTGGATRFQAFARVYNLTTRLGITIKADIGPDMTIGTWIKHYPGAHWHEREAAEMFGITFDGNPDHRHLYLPGDFEGHPMRKDFPLVARLIKPWPGIVDVEPMPEVASPSTDNPEGSQ